MRSSGTCATEFFDERVAVAKGTRLSNSACIELARSLGLVRLPSALLPRIKAVAVDLDNTLYEGVLGEDGVEGVHISAKHGAIQKELLRLREEGVFLAILSKNDERDFVSFARGDRIFFLNQRTFRQPASAGSRNQKALFASPNNCTSALIRSWSLMTIQAKLRRFEPFT